MGPSIFLLVLPEDHYQKKNTLLMLLAEERKSRHFEIHLDILFLTRPAFKGTILPKPNRLVFHQRLTDLGDRKLLTPSSSSPSFSPKEGIIKLRSTCAGHSPGSQAH